MFPFRVLELRRDAPVVERAEKVIEPLVRDDCRACGCDESRLICEGGIRGAWAMCAIPLPPRSMLNRVVGFVLAAMLLKVCGCDKYDDDDLDGDGDGGRLGGSGRTEASSSASRTLAGDHIESRVSDDGLQEISSSSS